MGHAALGLEHVLELVHAVVVEVAAVAFEEGLGLVELFLLGEFLWGGHWLGGYIYFIFVIGGDGQLRIGVFV